METIVIEGYRFRINHIQAYAAEADKQGMYLGIYTSTLIKIYLSPEKIQEYLNSLDDVFSN
jgi:hypothetical protein